MSDEAPDPAASGGEEFGPLDETNPPLEMLQENDQPEQRLDNEAAPLEDIWGSDDPEPVKRIDLSQD